MPVERTAKTKRPSLRRSRVSTACHRASSSITVGIRACPAVCSYPIDRSSITIIAHAGDGIYLDLALKLDAAGFRPILESAHRCSVVMQCPLTQQYEPRRLPGSAD